MIKFLNNSKAWENKKIYFIGIKGIGVSNIAQIFLSYGAKVSGSDDLKETFPADKILTQKGAKILPFSKKNITKDIDLIVYSTSYKENHPERKEARRLKIPQWSYNQALAYFFNDKKGILATGTHGKTTTTALLGKILIEAGYDPTVLAGGVVKDWKSNCRMGKSDWFIIEGDEYQEKFLSCAPLHLLITNIDYDHADFFPKRKDYENAFGKLIRQVKKGGSITIHKKAHKKFRRFFKNLSDVAVITPSSRAEKILKAVKFYALPGKYYEQNALLAVSLARHLGIKVLDIQKALENFKGVGRRLEFYTPKNAPCVIIDDYAHHPEEIKATLESLRMSFPKRKIIAVFQPHTYSRTKTFLDEFSKSFKKADEVFILEIYGSKREKTGKISAEILAEKIALNSKQKTVKFFKNLRAAEKELTKIKKTGKNFLIVTMGPGDVWKLADEMSR